MPERKPQGPMSEKSDSDKSCHDSGEALDSEHFFSAMYDELHRLALSHMRRERQDHTLQPTALIHEAYLRMIGGETKAAEFANATHFMATASVVMRRVLINHAKAKRTQKRGAGISPCRIEQLSIAFEERSVDLISLDEAIQRLALLEPNQAKLVEMRFFGGMTIEQCSEVLGISPRSLYYDWALARAWLRSQLEDV